MPIELKDATIANLMSGSAECYESQRWFLDQFTTYGYPGDAPASSKQAAYGAEISAVQRQKLFGLLGDKEGQLCQQS